jgi:hypothetical protein
MTIKMIKQNGVKYFKFVMDVNFIVLEFYVIYSLIFKY